MAPRLLKYLKINWVILIVNIIVVLPLAATLQSLTVSFTGNGPFISHTMSVEMRENIAKAGKEPTPLWGPIHSTGEWAIRFMTATLIIIPLGVTSNKFSMRRMKRSWIKMQKWAYIAVIFSVLHLGFLKGGEWQPYALIIGIGFVVRIPIINKTFTDLQKRFRRRQPVPASQPMHITVADVR